MSSKSSKQFIRAVLNIIISVLAVTVITVLLVWYYSNAVLIKYQYDAIDNYQQNVLRSTELNCNQLPKAVMQIFENGEISKFLHFKEITENDKIAAMNAFGDYLVYYNLNSVRIIHKKTDSIWSSADITRRKFSDYGHDSNIGQILELYDSGHNFINGSNLEKPESGIFYTYVNVQDYIFILNINSDEYERNILKYSSPFNCNTWIYYGDVVSITDSKEVSDPIQRYDLSKFDGKTKFNTSGLLFITKQYGKYKAVTAVPYKEFQKEIYKKIFILVIIAALIICVCIISLFIHAKYFKIIKSVYAKKLDEQKMHFEMGMWSNIVYKIFVGMKLSEEERKVKDKVLASDGYLYLPMLVLIDDCEMTDDSSMQARKLWISEAANDVFGGRYMCNTVRLERERMGMIVCRPANDDTDIYERTEILKNTIKQRNNLTVSMVVGEESSDSSRIEDNVLELFKTAQYHFISEPGSVIRTGDISEINSAAEYPKHLQRDIIMALRERNDDDFEKYCNEFTDYIKCNNYLMGRRWGMYLYNNVTNVFSADENENEFISFQGFGNIREIYSQLKAAAYDSVSDSTDDFKAGAMALIEENYADSDYNISLLAEAMGISSVYAGQKFKKVFDKSFNTVLAEYRCSQAAKLLTQTDKKSVEIAALCGFKSDTYYNYTFKKYMQSTPQQYRKAYKKI